jgi:hypothetical protein
LISPYSLQKVAVKINLKNKILSKYATAAATGHGSMIEKAF